MLGLLGMFNHYLSRSFERLPDWLSFLLVSTITLGLLASIAWPIVSRMTADLPAEGSVPKKPRWGVILACIGVSLVGIFISHWLIDPLIWNDPNNVRTGPLIKLSDTANNLKFVQFFLKPLFMFVVAPACARMLATGREGWLTLRINIFIAAGVIAAVLAMPGR